MPTYKFQCQECGMKFQKRVSVSRSKHLDCISCGKQVNRLVPKNVGVSFSGTDGSPLPQNTGVSSTDYNADRIIGESAARMWRVISNRNAKKHQILQENPGVQGEDLSRLPAGPGGEVEYHIMKPEERVARETALAIHKRASDLGYTGTRK